MEEVRIPDEILAEQWFGFVHHLISGMQDVYRTRRKTHGLSQKVLAEKLGKKPSFISRCLSGQQNMTIRTIHDIARAMGCRLEVRFVPLESLRPANNVPAKEAEGEEVTEKKAVPSGNFYDFRKQAA